MKNGFAVQLVVESSLGGSTIRTQVTSIFRWTVKSQTKVELMLYRYFSIMLKHITLHVFLPLKHQSREYTKRQGHRYHHNVNEAW